MPSLPLIVASIMSKKLALGAGSLILDVKCGSGAFRKSLPDAVQLARALREVARDAGVVCEALLTDMNQPLGPALGNACEVREALAVLRGRGSRDLREVTLRLAEEALVLRGRDRQAARASLNEALDGGAALESWGQFVEAHGGDPDPDLLARPERVVDVCADRPGAVSAIDGESLGRAAVEVGAGRRHRDEMIDHSAGVEVCVRLGDRIDAGQPLARLLFGKRDVDEAALLQRIAQAITLTNDVFDLPPLIHGTPDELSV